MFSFFKSSNSLLKGVLIVKLLKCETKKSCVIELVYFRYLD